MSASMPCFSKNRRVSSGYSVDTRTPCGQVLDPLDGRVARARPPRSGRAGRWPSSSAARRGDTTSLPVSSIQSRPVMPRSNSPSAT